jgi:hypothetical protein
MVVEIVTTLIAAATELLGSLSDVFEDVIALVYSNAETSLTTLGLIIVSTAGFALAWSGIRFIFGFVNRLLNKTRAGR